LKCEDLEIVSNSGDSMDSNSDSKDSNSRDSNSRDQFL
jgi:hypothetical protein